MKELSRFADRHCAPERNLSGARAVVTLLVIITLTACHEKSRPIAEQTPGNRADPVRTDEFGFGPDQNDSVGYDGKKWGSPLSSFSIPTSLAPELQGDFIDTLDGFLRDDAATVFKLPQITAAGLVDATGHNWGDTTGYNWSVVPKKFRSIVGDHNAARHESKCNFLPLLCLL